jgi:hypothetical protein
MKSDYSFKSITFSGARVVTHDPVAASVRPTTPNRVTIRIDAATIKRCAFKAGDMLTPFLDVENRAILLLSGQRPLPTYARKLWGKGKHAGSLEVEFPRTDEFEDLFPIAPIRGMVLREASHGRLVFTVPKVK